MQASRRYVSGRGIQGVRGDGIFDSVGKWFKGAAKTVGNTVTDTAKTVGNYVVSKPGRNLIKSVRTTLTPILQKAITPAILAAMTASAAIPVVGPAIASSTPIVAPLASIAASKGLSKLDALAESRGFGLTAHGTGGLYAHGYSAQGGEYSAPRRKAPAKNGKAGANGRAAPKASKSKAQKAVPQTDLQKALAQQLSSSIVF